jgi:hypothetical protein
MRSFFVALVLISAAAGTIILYYLVKHRFVKWQRMRLSSRIRKKMYEDDRIYIQSQLRHFINLLRAGDIMWILLSAGSKKTASVELTYSTVNKNIEIKYRSSRANSPDIETIKKLGAHKYRHDRNLHIICSPANAKIITDIIYFIFEFVFQYKPVLNLNLKTSGE